ncbi:MAG: integrase [Planctomycetaceae bacterium]
MKCGRSPFFRDYANEKIRAYIDLKLVTGLAIQDILTIKVTDLNEEGIHVHRKKPKGRGSKKKVYQWDPAGLLNRVVQDIHTAHIDHRESAHLFHTRNGKAYYPTNADGSAAGKPDGWNSMWQRRMKRFAEAGNTRFTDHDLRAKVASDTNLLHAQQLLDHTNKQTTENIYRRAPTSVSIARSSIKKQKLAKT